VIDGRYQIRVAGTEDIPAILELQRQNLHRNEGGLSVEFTAEWFERVLAQMPVVVACKDERIIGYLVSSPLSATAHIPPSQAKLRAYSAPANAYNYGPLCVSQDERGQGIPGALLETLRTLLPGRQGVGFIRADNAASLAANDKLGLRRVASFTCSGIDYIVVVVDALGAS
jgi:L-amino acid N-acyltransferase YncA